MSFTRYRRGAPTRIPLGTFESALQRVTKANEAQEKFGTPQGKRVFKKKDHKWRINLGRILQCNDFIFLGKYMFS